MACLKPAVHEYSFNDHYGQLRLVWPRPEAPKSLIHHCIMCAPGWSSFLPPSQAIAWAVGQAYRQSESSQRAHPADDPRQNTQFRKKPEKVSCEEHHKFLQYINNLFLHFSYSKSRKLKAQVVIAAQGLKQLGYQNK